MVDSQLVQNRRMKVVNVDSIVHRAESKVVCFAVTHSASDAATGHPGGKAVVIMIATISIL